VNTTIQLTSRISWVTNFFVANSMSLDISITNTWMLLQTSKASMEIGMDIRQGPLTYGNSLRSNHG
jgi:hypothetical protein